MVSSSLKTLWKLSLFSRNTTGTGECRPSWRRRRSQRRFHPGISRSLDVAIECKRAAALEPATLDWAFDLTKANMQTL